MNVLDLIKAVEAGQQRVLTQKPVAYICEFYADIGHRFLSFEPVKHGTNIPLYTHFYKAAL